MTEAEASDRWCPFVRQTWATRNECGGWSTAGHPAFNVAVIERTDPPIEHRCPCIASECMAWRETSERRGYCGLAGPVVLA